MVYHQERLGISRRDIQYNTNGVIVMIPQKFVKKHVNIRFLEIIQLNGY